MGYRGWRKDPEDWSEDVPSGRRQPAPKVVSPEDQLVIVSILARIPNQPRPNRLITVTTDKRCVEIFLTASILGLGRGGISRHFGCGERAARIAHERGREAFVRAMQRNLLADLGCHRAWVLDLIARASMTSGQPLHSAPDIDHPPHES